jgi:hypothetical protein
MEQYKEKLKHQNMLLSVGIVIMAGFSLLFIGNELGWFSFVRPITGDSHWHSRWNGFITGASCGIFALLFVSLIRNRRALKDEKQLKKLYVKEHDERTIQILTLARNTAMQILLMGGLVAVVIVGYFSITVSLTILACIFTASITSLLLVGYYSKKL